MAWTGSPDSESGRTLAGEIQIPSQGERNYTLGFFDDTGSYHDCPLWRMLGHELCGHALFRLGNEDQEIVPTATKLSESKTVLPASTALQRVDFTWIYGRANPLGDAQMEKLSISGPSPGSRYPAADAQPTTN